MLQWFLILYGASTLVSQSAMDFFATLILLGVGHRIYRRRVEGETWRQIFLPTGFEKIFLIWIIIVALSYLLSDWSTVDSWLRFFEFKWILQLYAITYAFCEVQPRSSVQKGFAIFISICSVYAITVWFLGYDPIKPEYTLSPWVGGHRTGGFFSSAMTFAHVYAIYFCMVLGLSFTALQWRSGYLKFLLPCLLVTGVALILSFTRGVWLSLGVATLAAAFLYRVRWGLVMSVMGSLGLWLATVIWPKLGQRITLAFESGDERQWIWQAHWKIFLEHPWLGVGYGQNHLLVPEIYKQLGAPEGTLVSHAHNQYLHWLAGAGVPGLLVYLAFLGGFLLLTLRVYKQCSDREPFSKGLVLGAWAAQISFLVGGLTEANFEHSKMKYAMMIVWAIVLWQGYERKVLRT